MAYTKQELLDHINMYPDDVTFAVVSNEAGEECELVDIFMDVEVELDEDPHFLQNAGVEGEADYILWTV